MGITRSSHHIGRLCYIYTTLSIYLAILTIYIIYTRATVTAQYYSIGKPERPRVQAVQGVCNRNFGVKAPPWAGWEVRSVVLCHLQSKLGKIKL